MITIVVAMAKNRVIGRGDALPWKLPQEMAYFKATTMGAAVVMGRKTFESIGKPLPGRDNVILTSQKDYSQVGVKVVHSVEEVLELAASGAEVMVIGGAEVYKLFLPHSDIIIQSVVEGVYEGDTYFPELGSEWITISELPKEGFIVRVLLRRELEV